MKPGASSKGPPKKVFVSSTCFDLLDARAELKRELETQGYVVYASEANDFPVVSGLSPADNCLAVLRECDVYLLIIHARYGSPYRGKILTLPAGYTGPKPSVTVAEYLTALEAGLEIRIWVRDFIWNTNPARRSAADADLRAITRRHAIDPGVYDFLNYIQQQTPEGGTWINQFHDVTDLKDSVLHWLQTKAHPTEERFRHAIADICQLRGYRFDRRILFSNAYVVGRLEDSPFHEEDAIWPFFSAVGKQVTWPDLRETVARIRDALDNEDYDRAMIVVSAGCQPEVIGELRRLHLARRLKIVSVDELLQSILPLQSYLERVVHDFESFDLFSESSNRSNPVISIMRRCDLKRYYVPLRVRASPPDLCEFIDDWLTAPDRNQLTILGNFGTGKSSSALWLTYTLAHRIVRDGATTRSPIFVSLRDHVGTLDVREIIVGTLINDYGVRNATYEAFQKLSDGGRLLVIFDGFDEIATLSDPVHTLRLLRELNSIVRRHSKVILTCRTHFFRTDQEAQRQAGRGVDAAEGELFAEQQGRVNYEIVHLQEFTPPQIEQFIQNHFGGNQRRAGIVLAQMHATYNLWDLAKRPVLLEMILKVFPRLQRRMGDQPITPAKLYQEYVQDWIGEVAKGNEEVLDQQSKRQFCVDLAKWMYREHQDHLPYAALESAIRDHFAGRPIGTYAALDVEIRTCSFQNRDGDGNYHFAHRSFMEFFVAEICAAELRSCTYDLFALRLLTFEVRNFLRGLISEISYYWDAVSRTKKHKDVSTGCIGANAVAMLRACDAVLCAGDFSFTKLDRADFTGCDLTGARFVGADLRDASVGNTILVDVDLRRADIRGITLRETLRVSACAWTSTHLFAASSDGSLRMWDCSTWQLCNSIRIRGTPVSIVASQGESILFVCVDTYQQKCEAHVLAYSLPDLTCVGELGAPGGSNERVDVKFTPLTYSMSVRGERGKVAMARRVDELEVSVRTFNCLKNAGVSTVIDLIAKTEAELLRIKNFGRKSVNEIKAILAKMGYLLDSGDPKM